MAALLALLLAAAPARGQGDVMSPLGDEAFAVMERDMAYDAAPLSARVDTLHRTANGRLFRVVYDGGRGRRVPAYLELPLDVAPPYRCVVLIHGLGRAKDFWWNQGTTTEGKLKDRLVFSGYAVLGVDLPRHGERGAEGDYEAPWGLLEEDARARLRDFFRDAVVEHRRGLDWLRSSPDIDGDHLGVLGYDMGASVAFVLAALEPDIGATVACVPPTMRDRHSLLATQTWAPRVRSPFLLLGATNSKTATVPEVRQLRQLLGAGTADLKIYTSDDRLPIWYVRDAEGWFTTHLPR